MAASLLQEISQDDVERAHAMSRKKYDMDMYSIYHDAVEDGEIRGEIRGHKKGLEEGHEDILKLLDPSLADEIRQRLKNP